MAGQANPADLPDLPPGQVRVFQADGDVDAPPDFQFPHEVLSRGKPVINVSPVHEDDNLLSTLRAIVDEAQSGRFDLESCVFFFTISAWK